MAEQNPECFEVYITRKGPVLVSGTNRVAILHSVIDRSEYNCRAVELCSVTADTKLPKSSIFSTLEDLVKKSVLKYGSVSGKKGYELDSYRILSSTSPHPEYADFTKDIIENVPENYGMHRMEFDYMATAALTWGLDVSPLLKTMGYDFGKYLLKIYPNREEALDRAFKWLKDASGTTASITSRLPLSVDVTYGLKSVSGELAKVMSAFVLSAISAIMENGYNVLIDRIEVDGNKAKGLFTISADIIDRDIVPLGFKYDDDAAIDFMIYVSSSGAFRCVDNPLGLAILEAMPPNTPMSSAEITRSLKIPEKKPQSSVLFYLEKMIAVGLVVETEVLGKRKFTKQAGDLYVWNPMTLLEPYDDEEDCRESLADPLTSFSHILSAIIRRLASLRIATGPVIGRLADALAKHFCDMSEKKTIESIMSLVMDKATWFKFSDTSVTSFVPFTFVRKVDKDMDDMLMEAQVIFDTKFFKTIIREITGVEYGAQCDVYSSDDSRGYKLTYHLQSR